MGIENTKKILILGLKKSFSMRDDETGEIIAGRRMHYAVPNMEKGSTGLMSVSACFMRDRVRLLDNVTTCGYYEAALEWVEKTDKKGKIVATSRFTGFRLLKDFKPEF